jgi:hypothetical protein
MTMARLFSIEMPADETVGVGDQRRVLGERYTDDGVGFRVRAPVALIGRLRAA